MPSPSSDDFRATKFTVSDHQLFPTILSAWLVAETKPPWIIDHARDPILLDGYQIQVLAWPSMANMRTILCAALPFPQLSVSNAPALVVKHLDNHTRAIIYTLS